MVVAFASIMSFVSLHNARSSLQVLVQRGFPLLLDDVERKGKWLPSFVKCTFERFLGCGDVRNGFAWLECLRCDSSHKIIPFSCGTRGFCPTCGGRAMVSQFMRWVDDVFPKVPVRQWVMTVPWGRRWLFARHHDLARGVLKSVFIRSFYQMNARWNAINLGLATMSLAKKDAPIDPEKWSRIFWINAGLDVGYVATGL